MSSTPCGLYVRELTGTREHLPNALITWSGKTLKSAIQSRKQIAWDYLDLHFNGEILEDDRVLSSYSINYGDTIVFTLRDGISIMELGGKITRIRNARDDWTISQLKTAVSENTGLDLDFIQLLYMGGKLHEDSKLLRDFLLSKVTVRPDGGW